MRADPKDEVIDFAIKLRDEIRGDKRKRYSVLGEIPPNRRAFYESVVRDFEKDGRKWTSASGTTLQIVMAWCRFKGVGFIVEYDPALNLFLLFATRQTK